MLFPSLKFKVAAVQAAPVAFDLEASIRKLERFTRTASEAGADLVVFPEGFLSAYPWRYAFDATIGAREPRGRQWYARYHRSAVAIPSPEKLIPTAAERLVWGRGAGDGLQVVDTDIGRVGGLICWENYMPAARLALYQQGIEVYIAPNADDLPAWAASMQHIAKEGRCFVISVNQFTRVSDFPSDYPPFTAGHHDRQPDGSAWTPEAILSHGGSCIVGPLGTFIAEPVLDQEAIVYGELSRGDLVEARMDFDAVGSYSRPDVFTLTVNRKPGTNVYFSEG
ncbi:Nitrilase [Exophiala xenobiotica]|nr:Nitrilase [Exophiala xenobiotica]